MADVAEPPLRRGETSGWLMRQTRRVESRRRVPHILPHIARRPRIPERTATMQAMRNFKMPSPDIISGVIQTVVYGGAATYGLYNR